MTRIYWRGCLFDARTAAMLAEVDRLLPGLPIYPSQGSYSTSVSASGNTHAGGGAVDLKLAFAGQGGRLDELSDADAHAIETAMRRVGFAAWYRPTLPGVWSRHVHGVAIGQTDASAAAKAQWSSYAAGRNGLAGNGPDTGTRAYVGATWESYVRSRDTAASPLPNLPTSPSTPSTPSTPTKAPVAPIVQEDEMFVAIQQKRGIWLLGPGYAHCFNTEEWDTYAQTVVKPGIAKVVVFDVSPVGQRQFDLVKAAQINRAA